ncbi:hypothetical protein SOVF_160560 [Spinacia oleracea]|nr:hypothetical protein SOVF_160560 [Spinacia oleracea]
MEEKKKGRKRMNPSLSIGGDSEFWATRTQPLNLQIDGAWKRNKSAKAIDGTVGVGWYSPLDRNNREGYQHIFASSPLQAETIAFWLVLNDMRSMSNRVDVITDSGAGPCYKGAEQGEGGDTGEGGRYY